MKACTVIITPAAGLGVQTFSGFKDKDGAPFVPKVFIPIGEAGKDSVTSLWAWSLGFDDGTVHVGETCQANNEAGLKGCAAGTSGIYSIMKYHDILSFGGEFYTWANITAIRSGEIDVTFALNNNPGSSYILVALGGDELEYKIVNITTVNSPRTVGFEAVALLCKLQREWSNTSSTGGGSLSLSFGWATKSDGNIGCASSVDCAGDFSSGDNARYQDSSNLFSLLFGTFLGATNTFNKTTKAISNWGSTTVTISGSNDSVGALALGGIQATSGTWTEPATDTHIDIDTTINRKLVIFVSTGQTGFGSINNSTAQIVIGIYDCVNNVSYWTGESYVGDTGASIKGARTISSSKLLRFATANGASTTFANQATAALQGNTSVRLTFTGTDGTQREGIWIALGDIVTPANPGAGIYQLVPGKKNDTVYTSQSPVTTEDMDIPNPFADGSLIGDEQ